MDHTKLTYFFHGRQLRLTDVYGDPIRRSSPEVRHGLARRREIMVASRRWGTRFFLTRFGLFRPESEQKVARNAPKRADFTYPQNE